MSLLKLYLLFVKIGAILLGGGYVILPILMSEFVEKRTLVKEEDLVNYFALSQSLPGIIAANISMFLGYKLKGFTGALFAMFGIITVPFVSIILLATLISKMLSFAIIEGIFWGIGIAVIALITLTIREILQKTYKNMFFYFIFITTLIGLLVFNLTPSQAIILFTIIGVFVKKMTLTKEVK